MAFDAKAFITQARAKGVPDAETYKYLQDKGIIDQSGKVNQAALGEPAAATPPTTGGQSFVEKVKGFATGALPAIGATVGGIAGGVVGSLGGPVGAYAGAVGGAAVGGAAGAAARSKIQGTAVTPGALAKEGAVYGATEAIGGPIASIAGKGLQAVGKGVVSAVLPKSEAEAAAVQSYKAAKPFFKRVFSTLTGTGTKAPSTAATVAVEKGLMGPESVMGVGAKKAQNQIWNKTIGPALAKEKKTIYMPWFFSEAEKNITKNVADLTKRKAMLEALEAMKEDYKGVGKITFEQLQKYKETWAELIPEKMYAGKPIAGTINNVRSYLADLARTKIYDTLGPGVKQAYMDYTNLYGITKLGKEAMKDPFIKGDASHALGKLLEMTVVPFATAGGQVVYRVGQGVELLGRPGARVVRDVLVQPVADTVAGLPGTPTSQTQSSSTTPTAAGMQ